MIEPDAFRRLGAGILDVWRRCAIQECLIEDCSAPVISAHCIQRRVLMNIAQDGHVYMIRHSANEPYLGRIGVDKATAFTGFCAKHDNDLFKTVDVGATVHMSLEDPGQERHLALRSMAHEYWKVLNNERILRRLVSLAQRNDIEGLCRFLNVERTFAKEVIVSQPQLGRAFLKAARSSLPRVARMYRSLLHQTRTGKYQLSKTATAAMELAPLVAVSGNCFIEYDLAGKQVGSLARGADCPAVIINILPYERRTLAFFLWHRRHDHVLAPFLSSLIALPIKERRILLSKLIVSRCEDFALSPLVVGQWPEGERERLRDLFVGTWGPGSPYSRIPRVDLWGDGIGEWRQ